MIGKKLTYIVSHYCLTAHRCCGTNRYWRPTCMCTLNWVAYTLFMRKYHFHVHFYISILFAYFPFRHRNRNIKKLWTFVIKLTSSALWDCFYSALVLVVVNLSTLPYQSAQHHCLFLPHSVNIYFEIKICWCNIKKTTMSKFASYVNYFNPFYSLTIHQLTYVIISISHYFFCCSNLFCCLSVYQCNPSKLVIYYWSHIDLIVIL